MRELFPEIEERNYSKVPLTEAEVRGIVEAAGGVARVLNATHATAKANGWKASPPGVEVFVLAAVSEPNLLRRPIVVADGRAAVGKSEAAWQGLK